MPRALPRPPASRLAAIDVGTNSVLLVVAEGGERGLRAICERCTITRLGRGVDASGRLDDAAIERTLVALEGYRELLETIGVGAIAAVGTSALRDADNAEVFLRPAAQLLGAPVRSIPGEREAELVIAGVTSSPAFGDLAAGALIFDVGGGSTELIEVGADRSTSATRRSLDIGSVRLTERLIRNDPPTEQERDAIRRTVDAALDTLPQSNKDVPPELVGVAGTLTTLVTVDRELSTYESDLVNGAVLTHDQIERVLARLMALPLAERRELPGLEPLRADVIIAGALIVERVLARYGGERGRLRVSDRGVRWGLLAELSRQRS
ncbi:MAG: hypothetical protein CSA65_09435 [Proteobacteria bacterium]|nr:MAG: hypothetical protein CSB49_08260 [Pseudomonadota bacterium]PIE17248.1 MAG: hypothetical protein CSA65_09435 [Pseudomonadota bacterium]